MLAATARGVIMARFKQGDRVRVLSPADSIYAGANGIIEDVKLHPRRITVLDSYTVVFSWGEKQKFWDAQLEPFSEQSLQAS
jgi:hypothetical protein